MAAQAGECAAESGRFRHWLSVVYGKQDSLGIKTWEAYAEEAGVEDAQRIGDCAMAPDTFPGVQAAERFAERLGLTEVPTILVNEWRLGAPPTPEELDEVIGLVRAGEKLPGGR